MKKQKSSSIINLCEVPSSDDETEKVRIKLDEEELRSCLKIIEDEESQDEDQVTPKRPKVVKRFKTPSPNVSTIIKPKKVISKKSPQNFLVQDDNFKKLQKKAKKLGADSLQYSKRKNFKYMIEYDNKKTS